MSETSLRGGLCVVLAYSVTLPAALSFAYVALSGSTPLFPKKKASRGREHSWA